jgi:hypothetical protein
MTLLEWTEKNIEALNQQRDELLNNPVTINLYKIEGAIEVLQIIREKYEQHPEPTREEKTEEDQPRSASLE